tara:strand:- start:143 stop:766 length:624 start_codon:yes stop_codon:yes gene_type:complete
MYQNPKRAKKLYPEVVPKAVDEYLSLIEKFFNQQPREKILNPVWHVHNGTPPEEKIVMPFSMLLNIVDSSNAKNKSVLWKFIKKFHKDLDPKKNKIFDELTGYAIKYFIDCVEPNKKFKKPNESEKKALSKLIDILKTIPQTTAAEEIQTKIYTVGKENGYSNDLRSWFKLIYEVTFGVENGPRMGFFISFFGVKETIDLMKKKLRM